MFISKRKHEEIVAEMTERRDEHLKIIRNRYCEIIALKKRVENLTYELKVANEVAGHRQDVINDLRPDAMKHRAAVANLARANAARKARAQQKEMGA